MRNEERRFVRVRIAIEVSFVFSPSPTAPVPSESRNRSVYSSQTSAVVESHIPRVQAFCEWPGLNTSLSPSNRERKKDFPDLPGPHIATTAIGFFICRNISTDLLVRTNSGLIAVSPLQSVLLTE